MDRSARLEGRELEQIHATPEKQSAPRGGWMVLVIILASAGVMFARANRPGVILIEGYPLVVAEPAKLDFGEHWEGSKFEWIVPILNGSDQTVVIGRIETSCGCVSSQAKNIQVLPRQTFPVRLEVTPTFRNGNADSSSEHLVDLKLFGPNDKRLLLNTQLTGRTKRLADAERPTVRFTSALVRGRSTTSEPLRLTPRVSLHSITASETNRVQASITQIESSYFLSVTLKPDTAGPLSHELVLDGLDVEGKKVGSMQISIREYVSDTIEAVPGWHHHGTVTLGSEFDTVVTLRNHADQPVRNVEWEIASPARITNVEQDGTGVTIRVQVSKIGANEVTLSGLAVTGSGDRVRVRSTLGWYAIQP
jgi:hypothetical protein